MKILIAKIILLFSMMFLISSNIYAENETDSEEPDYIKVQVNAKIPWAECEPHKETDSATSNTNDSNSSENKIEKWDCKVKKWFWDIIIIMWNIIKYFTYIASLSAVLFIVINWILYSMWWVDQTFKDEAKKRIQKTLVWLVLLLLSWIILKVVAPWVYN